MTVANCERKLALVNSPNENQMDLVVDFSLGLLSSDQEQVLLAAARENPELDAMLRQQCENFERLRPLQTPQKVTQVSAQPAVVRPLFRQPRTWFWTSAVAASLALVVWLSPGSDSNQYWLPIDEAMLVQRSDSSGNDGLRQGIEFYSAGKLPQAIVALQGAEVQGAMKDVRDIYLASALINAKRTFEAHKIMTDMDLESLPAPWRDYGYELLELSANP